jgi:hypothetical protein
MAAAGFGTTKRRGVLDADVPIREPRILPELQRSELDKRFSRAEAGHSATLLSAERFGLVVIE